METTTTLHGKTYSRQINSRLLQLASPIFKDAGAIVDVDSSGLPNKILDYVFDLIEDRLLPERSLSYNEYITLVQALNTFQMKEYYIQVLEDFSELISSFGDYEFASVVSLLLDNNINPNLIQDDFKYFPIKNPFESYVINVSKKTYLDYSYFSTAGETSRYSSLMPWHLNSVRNVMLKEIKNPRQIVDLTAHIGVDSVNFSILYPNASIISIEFDLEVYYLLRDNLLRYSIVLNKSPFNSRAYNHDASQILNHPMVISSDVAYLDPPWGGAEYGKQESIRLTLGNMSIEDVIKKLLQNGIKTVILKGPVNLYTQDLYKLGKIKRYEIYNKPKGGKLSYLLFFIRT